MAPPLILLILLVVTIITTTLALVAKAGAPKQLRLRDGRDLLEAGKADEALAIFAYLAKHGKEEHLRQASLLWLARCLEELESPGDAKDAYMNYLLKYSQKLSAEQLREVQHAMGRILIDEERKTAQAKGGSAWQEFLEKRKTPAYAAVEAAAELADSLEQSGEQEEPTQSAAHAQRARRDVSRLDTGERVGDYVIAEKLGEGGFGEVYRAILPVAIKFARDEGAVERLRRFSELQSRVDSERIVQPLRIDLEANPPYVVMELVDGPNLRVLIQRGPVPVATALALAEEVALALGDAHAAGVCHLDLKPENVLLDPSGRIKLTDFELGRLDVSALQQSLAFSTQDANPAGTLVYMSPEQRAGKTADARSDVFTFGVMLFELLTGTLPEPGDKPSQFVKGLPGAVDTIFERCFARHERRYANASEVLLDLRATRLEFPLESPLSELFGRLSEEAIVTTLEAEPEPVSEPPEPEPEPPEPEPKTPERDPLASEPKSPEPEPPESSKPAARPALDELMARQRLAESAANGKIHEGDSEPRRLAEPPQTA
jgi:serine/threonine protein kinase